MTKHHLRAKEFAARHAVTERTVRRWIAEGTIPSIQVGAVRLIPEDALDHITPPRATE
ncbi:excisionase family DNA-binding protein [Lolliginicoccus suaedae]|uniref:excisionase family DNA-binding protein n=1 Tax=Lolliginicoccus suaedae TaxID=2605429 RepID=UPI0011ECFF3D